MDIETTIDDLKEKAIERPSEGSLFYDLFQSLSRFKREFHSNRQIASNVIRLSWKCSTNQTTPPKEPSIHKIEELMSKLKDYSGHEQN